MEPQWTMILRLMAMVEDIFIHILPGWLPIVPGPQPECHSPYKHVVRPLCISRETHVHVAHGDPHGCAHAGEHTQTRTDRKTRKQREKHRGGDRGGNEREVLQ